MLRIGLAVLGGVPLTAQSSGISELLAHGRLAARAYRSENSGLPSDAISSLLMDRKGYLWAGTQQGAVRFNGWRWQLHNMPRAHVSNWVSAMAETTDGSLWFGTAGGGLHRLRNGIWTSYTDGENGFPRSTVPVLLEAPGPDGAPCLWVGTEEAGLWTLDAQGRATPVAGLPAGEAGRILALHWDGGALWVGSSQGVHRLAAGRWTHFNHANSSLPHDTVRCIFEQKDPAGGGVLWFGTQGGLARLDREAWTTWTPAKGLPCHAVVRIREARGPGGQRELYLATDGGLLVYRQGAFTVFGESAGIPGLVEDMLIQQIPGEPLAIWLASLEGLVKIQPQRWVSFQHIPGLEAKPDIFRILITQEPDGHPTLWLGTAGHGLFTLHRGKWTHIQDAGGHRLTTCYALVKTSDGAIWVGTREEGLFRLKGGQWSWFHRGVGLPDDRIYSMQEVREPEGASTLWVGTRLGLAAFDGRTWRVFTTADGLPSNLVDCVAEVQEPDGRKVLWVGTRNGGVSRREGNRWITYGEAEGLKAASVLSLTERKDEAGHRSLWIGTAEAGLWVLDLERTEPTWIRYGLTSRPALPSDTVYAVLEDGRKRPYLFTGKGVVRLTPRAPTPDDPAPFTTYTFTTADGLPSNDSNQGSFLKDEDGRLWAGTPSGAAVFDPVLDAPDAHANPLVLESAVRLESGQPLTPGATLAHGDNRLRFEWALLSYTKEEESQFRTQLVGLDAAPGPWGSQTSLDFPRLPAGSYTLMVWARDHAGNGSGPLAFPFEVRPAPWLTPWAVLLYLGLGALGIVSLIRFRTGYLADRNRQLEARIQAAVADLAASERRALDASRAKSAFLANMSHELRTPLNAILLYSELVRSEAEDRGEAGTMEDLDKISGAGKHLLALINGILDLSKIEAGKMEVQPEPVDLRVILEEVADTLRPLALQRRNEIVLELPAPPPALETDLMKLRQVLINLGGNAIKFTEGGRITFAAVPEGHEVRFEVRDTGIGMTSEQAARVFHAYEQAGTETMEKYGGTGLGLTITQRFLELLGGRIEVFSEVGRGTTFAFWLPQGKG
ncbi:MAG TPA: ATP-binding protein [Holophagaceae bacterium]|nr:ATP-binding protein [Holophagaceae bacterium]